MKAAARSSAAKAAGAGRTRSLRQAAAITIPARTETKKVIVCGALSGTFVAAGARATADAPLALIAFEGAADDPARTETHLTLWPSGDRRLLT